MIKNIALRVVKKIKACLFGDRDKFGVVKDVNDPMWQEWIKKVMPQFYDATQKNGIGRIVNNHGYTVMEGVQLSNKIVAEIGPGALDHIKYWGDIPKKFYIIDISKTMAKKTENQLQMKKVCFETIILDENNKFVLPFEDESIDIFLSFYSLEHLYPLNDYLTEIKRVIKKEGIFMGAFPCEGGLAWGFGRFITTRRWLKNNTNINPDKIICWEHPNTARHIISQLCQKFDVCKLNFWPIHLQSINFNLVTKFICRK